MDFVTPLITIICHLMESISTRITRVVNLDQSVHSLETALDELTEARDDLKGRVDQAEALGSTCTNQVRGWLERVEKIEVEVRSIIQDVDDQRKCLWCCSAHCCSRYRLSKKVQQNLRLTNDLKEKKQSLDTNMADESVLAPVVEIPIRPAIGLDVMLEKVRQLLGKKDFGIIGIYGMGGVGKTTLLMCINNEFLRVNHNFNVVIWALVSKEFVAEKIQQAIGMRLGLTWDRNESQEQRASTIYNVMRKKKFLLLLDDVWEGIDLEKIGIPLPNKENECKLVFTARSMDVCSDMDAHCKLKVDFLKEKESWELFCKKVGRSEILHNSPPIRSLAETIVRKCGGLPLALITTGRAMANKETEEEWRYAIQVLSTSPSELRGMEDVFTILKFSFDNLGNDTLRLCFLYCTLFPEDCSIEIEQLIEYWEGEGFLDSSYDDGYHNMGHAFIGSLKVACFLETGDEDTHVKMHDVVRSFALWIASECGVNENKFLVHASAGLTIAPGVEKWKGAHRISLLDNEITELSEIPVCPHLLTLLLQWNMGLSKISNGFFQFMPALKVLDLSHTSLKEIPESINELVELHHLNLSGTMLTTLPKNLGGLKKLRHLDLQRTRYLRTIPSEAISGLSQLRVFNMYYSYGGWEMHDFEGENEVGFADLERLKHLTSLGLTVTDLATLKSLFFFKFLLKSIRYMYIKECDGLSYFPLSQPGDGEKLRRLSINNCCDLKYVAIGLEAGKNWLPSLEVLALHGLPNMTSVWRNPVTQGWLQNLRSISIWHCDKLKNVSWVLQLPRLELIYLFYCKEIEEVISGDLLGEEDAKAFPRLRTLSIRDLPELTSICKLVIDFPYLERFAVIDCPKLKKLPLKVSAGLTIPTVYGDKEWWDQLDWDEDPTKSSFKPHFMAT